MLGKHPVLGQIAISQLCHFTNSIFEFGNNVFCGYSIKVFVHQHATSFSIYVLMSWFVYLPSFPLNNTVSAGRPSHPALQAITSSKSLFSGHTPWCYLEDTIELCSYLCNQSPFQMQWQWVISIWKLGDQMQRQCWSPYSYYTQAAVISQ